MAKEKHSKMASDRMFRRTSRFLREEAAPDVIDRGTRCPETWSSNSKWEINTGARTPPTPQVPSNWCSHTGLHPGGPPTEQAGVPPPQATLPAQGPGGSRRCWAPSESLRGSKEDTGRPGSSRVGPSTPVYTVRTCVYDIHTRLHLCAPACPCPHSPHLSTRHQARPCPSR